MITDRKAVEAAAAALDLNDKVRGLEPHAGLSTQVWHMLCSLLDFCDYHSLDFNLILEDVRQDYVERRPR